MAVERLNRKQLIETIHAKQGVLSQVARALDVTLPTIYNYRNRYASVAQAIEDSRNRYDTELLDEAEYKLRESVRNGDAWAVKYVLDKKGKVRGFGDDVKLEQRVTLHMDWGDNASDND